MLICSNGCETNKSSLELKSEITCNPGKMTISERTIFDKMMLLSFQYYIGPEYHKPPYTSNQRHIVIKEACLMYNQYMLTLEENF